GYARCDAEGGVQILPADADLDDPATWLPLGRVLELLKQARAPRRLLVLDLQSPPAGTRPTILLDDLAESVARDVERLPDDRRLVLCSAGPGQRAWASEVLERSAFGHYFDDGLRGRADTDRDGRVTVRELAAYMQQRVDRWAMRTREAHQRPVL